MITSASLTGGKKVVKGKISLDKSFTCNNMVITMQIQTIFKAGNSNVVTIPSQLMQQLNFQVGERVVVEKSPVGQGLVIKKSGQVKYADELGQWFKIFIKENGKILDELAVR